VILAPVASVAVATHRHTRYCWARLWGSDGARRTNSSSEARKAIRAGKLPTRLPDRIWGGPGIGKTCPICGGPITKNQLEFEIQYARDGAIALALAALENGLVGNVEFLGRRKPASRSSTSSRRIVASKVATCSR
jgi:hypothetical protein